MNTMMENLLKMNRKDLIEKLTPMEKEQYKTNLYVAIACWFMGLGLCLTLLFSPFGVGLFILAIYFGSKNNKLLMKYEVEK